ncbi:MAG: hypothetical protein L6406_19775 [Desulfobacterales bacterium]|nr:hypothetical protein [Desulfobacterales bacterium]
MGKIIFYGAWLILLLEFIVLLIRLTDGYVDMVDFDGFSGENDLTFGQKVRFRLRLPIS